MRYFFRKNANGIIHSFTSNANGETVKYNGLLGVKWMDVKVRVR